MYARGYPLFESGNKDKIVNDHFMKKKLYKE